MNNDSPDFKNVSILTNDNEKSQFLLTFEKPVQTPLIDQADALTRELEQMKERMD